MLINFLRVERLALLVQHPTLRFIVTDHVAREISDIFAEQRATFDAAIAAGSLEQIIVNDLAELEAFRKGLSAKLGNGECAAIAVASVREMPLAIDDMKAIKVTQKLFPHVEILDTADIMVSLIQARVIDVHAADALRDDWEEKHRFKLPFASFAEMLE